MANKSAIKDYHVYITIEDEGYFKKTYYVKATVDLHKVLDLCSAHVCPKCSNTGMLEFWYNTTKLIGQGQTPFMLGMQDGDIINIIVKETCTRGACPLPRGQTLPNMHYLSTPVRPNRISNLFRETAYQPKPPDRVRLRFVSQDNFEMQFRLNRDDSLKLAMQVFASHVKREVEKCRFLIDGERIVEQTAESLELDDDDVVQVFYEVLGGGGAMSPAS